LFSFRDNHNRYKMNRILRDIFYISYILTFTYIYGNWIVLLMKKIAKEKPSYSLINNVTTTITTTNHYKVKIHYPTMLILQEDENIHDNML
jgi:hypothetical protein